MAKDLALIAQRWNVIADIKVFTDERITAENFKVGQCDAAGISTLRARQFNLFMGSIDSVGGVPDYASSTGKAGMSLSRSIRVGVGPTMSSAWQ